jgi:hypothetical protein
MLTFRKLFFLHLGITFLQVHASEDPRPDSSELVTYFYSVNPSRWSTVRDESSSGGDPFGGDSFGKSRKTEIDDRLQLLFQRYGVKFPEGSYLRYEPVLTGILFKNTEENHETFFKILNRSGVDWRQVQINFFLVSLPLEKVKMNEETGDNVLALWDEGEAQLRMKAGVVIINGVNAVHTFHFLNATGEKQRFTMNLTSTVQPSERSVSVVALLEQKPVDNKNKPVDPDGSGTWELTTSVVVTEGNPLLLSSYPDAVGNQQNYLFITAQILPKQPVRIKGVELEEEENFE